MFGQREPSRTVYKPIYSRFAAQTVVRPQGIEALDGIEPTATRPWIAQEYLPGRPFATFSIAHQGRIAAHATYATDFCHNFGPTVVYRRAEQPAVLQWVRTFIDAVKYTGQVGFDFIEDASGRIAAIECNPRLTGGMYLLKDDPRFAAAYLDPTTGPIEADRGTFVHLPILVVLDPVSTHAELPRVGRMVPPVLRRCSRPTNSTGPTRCRD